MQPAVLMQTLLDLAEEVGLEVRPVRAGAEGEPPLASGVCRVKGRVWLVLSAADPVDVQVSALAAALVTHAGEALEERYLPPAVRAALDAVGGG